MERDRRSSEWGTSAGGETLSFGSTFCQLGFSRVSACGFVALVSGDFHGSFVFACGNSSVGRAQPCQGWGRGFESRFPLSFLLGLSVALPAGSSFSARVAKPVDARDLKSLGINSHAGSIPAPSTRSHLRPARRFSCENPSLFLNA